MAVASTSGNADDSAAAFASSSTAAPSPTLYVKNIEGKIKKPGKSDCQCPAKRAFVMDALADTWRPYLLYGSWLATTSGNTLLVDRVAELRQQLLALFSTYGRVLDVVATRAPSMRGQAFVVFESVSFSSAAKRGLEGFPFYGKSLHIEYSTGTKSKALLKRELGHEALMERDWERSHTLVSRRSEKRDLLSQQDAEEDENTTVQAQDDEATRRKRAKLDKVLLVAERIPATIQLHILQTLFQSHSGFVDVIPADRTQQDDPKQNNDDWTAHIHFDSKAHAEAARNTLDGVQLDPLYKLDLHFV